jgi:CRP-like cAMP-binding protein
MLRTHCYAGYRCSQASMPTPCRRSRATRVFDGGGRRNALRRGRCGDLVLRRTRRVGQAHAVEEGHLVVLRLVASGEAFGGVSAFGGDSYPVGAHAITPVSALEWSGSAMASLMERYPRLAMNAFSFVAAHLHDLQVRYRELATEKVERRVARARSCGWRSRADDASRKACSSTCGCRARMLPR